MIGLFEMKWLTHFDANIILDYLQNDNSTGMPQQHVTCFDQSLSNVAFELFKTIISRNTIPRNIF